MITRTCTGCGVGKELSEFHRNAKGSLGLQSRCKVCQAVSKREWYAANKDGKVRAYTREQAGRGLHRDRHLRRSFGITLSDYNAILADQGGRCAVCRSTDSGDKRFDTFCVDHCHDTNKVRGLLCAHCNKAIGHMKDDPNRLMAAVAYLLAHTDALKEVG